MWRHATAQLGLLGLYQSRCSDLVSRPDNLDRNSCLGVGSRRCKPCTLQCAHHCCMQLDKDADVTEDLHPANAQHMTV